MWALFLLAQVCTIAFHSSSLPTLCFGLKIFILIFLYFGFAALWQTRTIWHCSFKNRCCNRAHPDCHWFIFWQGRSQLLWVKTNVLETWLILLTDLVPFSWYCRAVFWSTVVIWAPLPHWQRRRDVWISQIVTSTVNVSSACFKLTRYLFSLFT